MHFFLRIFLKLAFNPVLWIRIRMDPELCLDPDPAKYERADK